MGKYLRLAMLALLMCALVLSACSTSAPKRKRVKLSDASAEAAKKPEDQKPLRAKAEKKEKVDDREEWEEQVREDERRRERERLERERRERERLERERREAEMEIGFTDSDSDDAIDTDIDYGDPVAPPGVTTESPFEGVRAHWGLVLGGGSLSGEELDGFGLFGLQGGPDLYEDRVRLDIRALYIPTNRTPETLKSTGLKGEFELAADLDLRYYFTPAHTFMGIYALAGFRVGYLFWDFKNPVTVFDEEEGEVTLNGDRVGYLGLFTGVGVSVAQFKMLHIGLNGNVGYKIYKGTTGQGLENDLFGDEPFFQIMVEVSGLRYEK